MAQYSKQKVDYLNDGRSIFEVVMIADQFGTLVGPSNPSGMAVDAFGRARSSSPVTLFDSFNRYKDNQKFATSNTAGANTEYNANTSTVLMNVGTSINQEVIRESTLVFAYQPGKSLQIINTFVMGEAKTGLRQRVGYFGAENGVYLERDGEEIAFVLRSSANNTTVDTRIIQSAWNVDKLDGDGVSKKTLDLEKSNIFFVDVEWLGVGSVRCGFVIDGQLIHCHSFHHAGVKDDVYMSTAVLPVRYEIKNTAGTASASTLKQICSTVISEGGYSLSGKPRSFGLDPVQASQFALATAGTYYPVLSFRLNPAYPDSIVVPIDFGIFPINTGIYRYKVVKGGTVAGAVWANTSTNSIVQYNSNTSATFSGGEDMMSGYFASTNQASGSASLKDGLFKFQLERDSLANTFTPLTLLVTCANATSNVVASMDWEEVT
jgi:hypothetical protein